MLLKGMNMLLNDEYVVSGISHVPSFALTFFFNIFFYFLKYTCGFAFFNF